MKKKIKYTCIFVFIIIFTVSIILMPKYYYKSNDTYIKNSSDITELGINIKNENPSIEEIYKIINSSTSINFYLSNNILSDKDLTAIVNNAMTDIIPYLSSNSFIYYILNQIKTYYLIDNKLNVIQYRYISDEINNKFMSVSIIEVSLRAEDSDINMIIDFNTGKIYNIFIYNIEYYVDKYKNNMYDKILSFSTSSNTSDEDEAINDFYKDLDQSNSCDTMKKELSSYWLINPDNVVINYNDYMFQFSFWFGENSKDMPNGDIVYDEEKDKW